MYSKARKIAGIRGLIRGLAAAIVLIMSALPFEARAISVTETGANLTKNSETASNTASMKFTLERVEDLLDAIWRSLGQEGGVATSSGPGGLLSFSADALSFNDPLGSSQSFDAVLPDTGLMRDAGELLGGVAGVERISGVSDALRLVRDVYNEVDRLAELQDLDPRDLPNVLRDVQNLRDRFRESSAQEALAVALTAREAVSNGSRRVTRLSREARKATNLREQMATLTAVATSNSEELQRLQALLGTYIQSRTAAALSERTLSVEGFLNPASGPPAQQPEQGANDVDIFGQ